MLVEPDNAEALAAGLRLAVAAGPLTLETRQRAGARFSVEQSARELLVMLARPTPASPASVVEELEQLILLESAPPPAGRIGLPVDRPSPHDTTAV